MKLRIALVLLLMLAARPALAVTVFPNTVVVAGTTGVILTIPMVLASDGTLMTGLVFNSATIAAKYCPDNASGACTAITLTGTCTLGAYTSGCFLEKDAGVYQFHPPNAAFAVGINRGTIRVTGVTNSDPLIIPYEVVAIGTQTLATTIGTPASTVSADIAAVKVDTAVASTGTTNFLAGFYRKNVAAQVAMPMMLYLTGTSTVYAGAANTVTMQVNKDGAGWTTACAAPCSTVTGGGSTGLGLFWYAPAQSDTNCSHCMFRATASGVAPSLYSIRTAE